MKKFDSVAAYLRAVPPAPRAALQQLRKTIKAAACSLFMSTALARVYKKALAPYQTSKGTIRITGDVGTAEDLAQDALVAALERWPESGVPDNPGAWLMATAKNRAIDVLRRGKLLERKHAELGHELEARQESPERELAAALDDHVGDDLLGLMFTACHPVLATEARTALTLRLLGGLTTDEIARAFLVPKATIAQRIVRASSAPRGTSKGTRVEPSSPPACRRSSR